MSDWLKTAWAALVNAPRSRSETFDLPHVGVPVTGHGAVGIEFARLMAQTDRRMAEEEGEWVARLRADGVKAAHPDDGWVDRHLNEVYLCYPQFNDGLGIGARLALGWPDRYRIVRVTGSRALTIDPSMIYWRFEVAREGVKSS